MMTREDIAKLSDVKAEAQIAEVLGWTEIHHEVDRLKGRSKYLCGHPPGKGGKPSTGTKRNDVFIPSYCSDLNAMHEAENSMTDDQRVRFRLMLMFNSDGPKAVYSTVEAALCHATARQRAEAFLATNQSA